MYTYMEWYANTAYFKAEPFEKAIDDKLTDEVMNDYWLAYWMNAWLSNGKKLICVLLYKRFPIWVW